MKRPVLVFVLGSLALGLAAERVVADPQGGLKVQELRDGVPVWELTIDPAGLPSREVVFRDGVPVEFGALVYQNRRLVLRQVSDAQGQSLYTERLSWWPDGTLRRLEREGDGARVAWSYRDGRLASTWTEGLDGPGAHREWASSGDQTREALVRDGRLVVERLAEWGPEGSKETRNEPDLERSSVRRLDSRGRVVAQTVTVAGNEVSRSQWAYEGDRLRSLSTQTPTGFEVWSYRYEGTITHGTLTRDGLVVQEETLDDGNLVEARYFDRGALVLVETWSQGKKTREAYFQNNELVKERLP